MLRCRVSAREVLLERAPVDQVGAAAGTQDDAGDRGLALAGGAVAGAGGEVDGGRGDRLGEDLLVGFLGLLGVLHDGVLGLHDRVRVDVLLGLPRPSGSTPSGTMSTSRWAPGHDRFLARGGRLLPLLVLGLAAARGGGAPPAAGGGVLGLLVGLQGRVLGGAGDLAGVLARDRVGLVDLGGGGLGGGLAGCASAAASRRLRLGGRDVDGGLLGLLVCLQRRVLGGAGDLAGVLGGDRVPVGLLGLVAVVL